jgi:hypothetical protein
MGNLKKFGLVGAVVGASLLAGCGSSVKNLETGCDISSRMEIKEIYRVRITKEELTSMRGKHTGTLSKADFEAVAFYLVWEHTGRLSHQNGTMISYISDKYSINIIEEEDANYVCLSLEDIGIDYEVVLGKNLEFGYIEQK